MNRRLVAISTALLAAFASAQNQGLVLQNGNTDWVDVPFSPSLVPTGGITVEAWVTYDGSTLGSGWRFPTLFRMDPTPNQASYFLRVEAGQSRTNRLLWWVGTTTGNYSVGYTFPAATLLTWAHVAGTYDGSAIRLFVNGVQVAQATATGVIQNRGGVLRIGGGDTTIVGGETWNGEIDEARIWPFARSAAAILAASQQRLSSMPGEVSTWNFDGDALDSSGNNHGAAVGNPAFAANSLVLQQIGFPGSLNLGAGSGCRSSGLTAIPSLAQPGNAGFGLVGTRAPANQGGFALLSTATLPSPWRILGIDILLDGNAGSAEFLQSNALGTATLAVPIPNNARLVGLGLFAQFLWIDGSCAGGASAANAVLATVLP